jgi:hypothetical protein
MKSVMITAISIAGINASTRGSGASANGAVAPNPSSKATATKRAIRICRRVGGRFTSHVSVPSDSGRAAIRATFKLAEDKLAEDKLARCADPRLGSMQSDALIIEMRTLI